MDWQDLHGAKQYQQTTNPPDLKGKENVIHIHSANKYRKYRSQLEEPL
jgi:hypothetical protein